MKTRVLVQLAVKGTVLGIGAVLGAGVVIAWTGPTGTAPNSNVSAPVNVGTTAQVKNGGLSVNSMSVTGNAFVAGSISTDEGVIRDAGGGWVRTYGNTGWYNGTWGGGWYMNEQFTLRAYGNKNIYTGGRITAGGAIDANGGLTSNTLTVNNGATINSGGIYIAGGGFRVLSPGQDNGTHALCWHQNTGAVTRAGTCQSSDARLKEHIQPLQAGLFEILKLNPVTFEWKDKGRGEGTKLGLIAQEVKAVFPEVVSGSETAPESGSFYSVDYNALIAPMIKAIQELKAENDALRARVEKLEAKN